MMERRTAPYEALPPLEIASYLRLHGWHEQTRSERSSVWLLSRDENYDVVLPLQRHLADFRIRIDQLLETLTAVERRSKAEIAFDIMTNASDVIRIRAMTRESDDGSLPIHRGVGLVSAARDLLLAAACATVSKRAVFPTRKPTIAADYLDRVQIGQTERGSFVLTILAPITPLLTVDLPFEEPEAESFELRVTRTLVDSLVALSVAADANAASGSSAEFDTAVERGVSANLCDAVVALASVGSSRDLDLQVSWSPRRPEMQTGPVTRVRLEADRIPYIAEASRQFRRRSEEREDTLLFGSVVRLDRAAEETSGRVIVSGFVGKVLRRVLVELDAQDYEIATEAHRDKQVVACLGTLVREGSSYRLDQATNFGIVHFDSDQSSD